MFVAHEIATGLRGGYQVVAADLNRDGKPDLVAVSSGLTELIWFENPSWTRHVIASGVAAPINVAVADIDRDGIPEIALAYGFSTNPAQSAGNVVLFTHGADVNAPWTPREIDRVPSAHRLRWYTAPNGERWLINSPLAGATAAPPDYKGATPIYVYRPPEWKRELVTDKEEGVVHAIEPLTAADGTLGIYAAGFMGIHGYRFAGGAWTRESVVAGDPAPWPKGGSSDVAFGRTAGTRFVAAIEPWHGNEVVVYRAAGTAWTRTVIDTAVTDGHTLVVADFDKDGRDEIVVGQRGGSRNLWLYTSDASGTKWMRSTIDDNMAAAGCTSADFDGDGRTDLACIATVTANLKWYRNN